MIYSPHIERVQERELPEPFFNTHTMTFTVYQRQVSTGQMSRVVEDYIEQEKGIRIVVRPMVGETVAHLYGIPPSTSIEKQLLLRAYAWAKDHLKQ